MNTPLMQCLSMFRRALFNARNRNEIDDKTLNDVLILLDAAETILRESLRSKTRKTKKKVVRIDRGSDPLAEIRKILILMRRRLRELHQRKEICKQCYNKFLNIITDLELKVEEYEYEEALRRWG